jgi:putative flippase GtrA
MEGAHEPCRSRAGRTFGGWHRRELPAQFLRYLRVSLLALALDFDIFVTLTRSAMKAALAGAIAYALAMLLHYLLSVAFVFDAQRAGKSKARLVGEFALSGLAGLVITALVIEILTEFAAMPALSAKVVATAMSFLAVFTLRRIVVFAEPAARVVSPVRRG